MLGRRSLLALTVSLPLAGCAPAGAPIPRKVLLAENFNGENDGTFQLNYTDFARWEVPAGTVDLVGTPPFDDFLPTSQGLYVDLDGSSKAAGTLRSRARFDLTPGRYRLERL